MLAFFFDIYTRGDVQNPSKRTCRLHFFIDILFQACIHACNYLFLDGARSCSSEASLIRCQRKKTYAPQFFSNSYSGSPLTVSCGFIDVHIYVGNFSKCVSLEEID